jgi:oxaloacetate decarboxylase alpha subunit
MVAAFRGTRFDTRLSLDKLNEIAEYFKPLKENFVKSGLLDTKVMGVDVNALIYQGPGGMLSNLVSQLKQAGKADQYDNVLKEVPKVRKDFGYPPLVTPTSQIVGTQSVMNVISGERYKMVPKESKALVKGEYGRTPAPISDAVKAEILKGEAPITCRPADLIEPELDKIRTEMKQYLEQEEDVLSYALFPQVSEGFFKYRQAQKYKIEDGLVSYKDNTHPV